MVEQQREPDESLAARRLMVEDQIRRRGVRDQRVLEAMLAIPRNRFVPADVQASAYEDRALPVGHSQTISQPFIVAYMTEQLAVNLRSPDDIRNHSEQVVVKEACFGTRTNHRFVSGSESRGPAE